MAPLTSRPATFISAKRDRRSATPRRISFSFRAASASNFASTRLSMSEARPWARAFSTSTRSSRAPRALTPPSPARSTTFSTVVRTISRSRSFRAFVAARFAFWYFPRKARQSRLARAASASLRAFSASAVSPCMPRTSSTSTRSRSRDSLAFRIRAASSASRRHRARALVTALNRSSWRAFQASSIWGFVAVRSDPSFASRSRSFSARRMLSSATLRRRARSAASLAAFVHFCTSAYTPDFRAFRACWRASSASWASAPRSAALPMCFFAPSMRL